ncbi:hypothetical protein ACIP4W_21440 [Streptomyces sp. NPDC088846]|uniref:hypothetical protein n=1 Tax=Streptomyces sp. NPDC088846 TaxID=3365908 RepID=UPI00381588F3
MEPHVLGCGPAGMLAAKVMPDCTWLSAPGFSRLLEATVDAGLAYAKRGVARILDAP